MSNLPKYKITFKRGGCEEISGDVLMRVSDEDKFAFYSDTEGKATLLNLKDSGDNPINPIAIYHCKIKFGDYIEIHGFVLADNRMYKYYTVYLQFC
jgi:hypothetical protein